MTFEYISQLLKSHTSIRLLKADNAPLIISFLFETFKENFTNQGEGGIKRERTCRPFGGYALCVE